MEDSLAILVAAENHMRHVVSLTKAAHESGKCVYVLFSGRGVKLVRDPGFRLLESKAHISICEASFREHGLAGQAGDLHEAAAAYLTTQIQQAELIEKVERCVVF